MSRALIEGIILGITLAFMIGPAFISLVQTSIYKGPASGIQFAAGIALSDFVLIALSYLGTLKILGSLQHQMPVGIIGGAILIAFGIYTFKRKTKISESSKINVALKPINIFKHLFKGFFMNIFNPFLLIFWIGVVSIVTTKYGFETAKTYLFFAGTITGVFLTDTVKCIIAHKIRNSLNFKMLIWVNRIVGIILVAFGLLLIVRVVLMFM